jgi:hypothetical protein
MVRPAICHCQLQHRLPFPVVGPLPSFCTGICLPCCLRPLDGHISLTGYHRTMYATTTLPRTNLRVLQGPPSQPRMHQLNGNASTPIFRHLGSSSWHSWDAAFFKLFRHPSQAAGGLLANARDAKCATLGLVPLLAIFCGMVLTLKVVYTAMRRRRLLGGKQRVIGADLGRSKEDVV